MTSTSATVVVSSAATYPEVALAAPPIREGDDEPAEAAEARACEQDRAEIEMRHGAGEQPRQAPHHGRDPNEQNAAPVQGGRGRHRGFRWSALSTRLRRRRLPTSADPGQARAWRRGC